MSDVENTREVAIKTWETRIAKALVGRKIVGVRYMGADEAEGLGWHDRSIVLVLDDGTQLFPSQDEEGNGAGALFTTISKLETIPTFPS